MLGSKVSSQGVRSASLENNYPLHLCSHIYVDVQQRDLVVEVLYACVHARAEILLEAGLFCLFILLLLISKLVQLLLLIGMGISSVGLSN